MPVCHLSADRIEHDEKFAGTYLFSRSPGWRKVLLVLNFLPNFPRMQYSDPFSSIFFKIGNNNFVFFLLPTVFVALLQCWQPRLVGMYSFN